MSNLVKADPESIREFARRLKEFCETTQANMSGLRNHLNEMENTSWGDRIYSSYRSEFESVATQISGIIDGINPSHIDILARHAQRLDDYLNG